MRLDTFIQAPALNGAPVTFGMRHVMAYYPHEKGTAIILASASAETIIIAIPYDDFCRGLDPDWEPLPKTP